MRNGPWHGLGCSLGLGVGDALGHGVCVGAALGSVVGTLAVVGRGVAAGVGATAGEVASVASADAEGPVTTTSMAASEAYVTQPPRVTSSPSIRARARLGRLAGQVADRSGIGSPDASLPRSLRGPGQVRSQIRNLSGEMRMMTPSSGNSRSYLSTPAGPS